MSLTLTLHTQPKAPLEAEVIVPERLRGLSADQVSALRVLHGNQDAELGEFFRVEGAADGEVRVAGDASRVKRIGWAMGAGRLVIDGHAGMHLGAAMSGGAIEVRGNAGDWAGAEMSGGRIEIRGNAGHMVGCALRGSRRGIGGGEIIIHGNAGNEVGGGMRRGLIAVGGDSGDFTGVNMLAGSIVVLGRAGWRTGAGMRRGSIVCAQPFELLPTFGYACSYRPVVVRMVLGYLRARGLPVTDAQFQGRCQRWSGDAVELNRGEILLLQQ